MRTMTVKELLRHLLSEIEDGDDTSVELKDAAEMAAFLIEDFARRHPEILDLENAEV